MKVHLSLFDADMNKIMGSINDKSSTTYSSIIMVNGKAIGKFKRLGKPNGRVKRKLDVNQLEIEKWMN